MERDGREGQALQDWPLPLSRDLGIASHLFRVNCPRSHVLSRSQRPGTLPGRLASRARRVWSAPWLGGDRSCLNHDEKIVLQKRICGVVHFPVTFRLHRHSTPMARLRVRFIRVERPRQAAKGITYPSIASQCLWGLPVNTSAGDLPTLSSFLLLNMALWLW